MIKIHKNIFIFTYNKNLNLKKRLFKYFNLKKKKKILLLINKNFV